MADLHKHTYRYCRKFMAYIVEDERHFMLELTQHIRRFELFFLPNIT